MNRLMRGGSVEVQGEFGTRTTVTRWQPLIDQNLEQGKHDMKTLDFPANDAAAVGPNRICQQLGEWIESVLDTYELPAAHAATLARILDEIRLYPERIVALEVGRLMQFFERNGLVTDKTSLADQAIQHLIECGRTGAIDSEKGALRQWFRKHYFWATTTTTIEVAATQGEDADELIQRYFRSCQTGIT